MIDKEKFNLYDLQLHLFGNVKDKQMGIYYYVSYMLDRCLTMIKLNNLPIKMDERETKLKLFTNGNILVGKADDGEIYGFVGGWGGKPNADNLPTEYIVNNPYLKFNKTFNVDVDGVVVRNDSLCNGILPILERYASLLVESDITMRMVNIHYRIPYIVSAMDDSTKESAKDFFKKIENGEDSIVGDMSLFDGVDDLKSNPFNNQNSSNLTELVEYHQYIKSSMFIELGLNSNFNMKRESLNDSETTLNDDILQPLVDNIHDEWQKGFDKVNKMFGLNIQVELNGVWKDNKIEHKKEIESIGNGGDEDGKNKVENDSTTIDG